MKKGNPNPSSETMARIREQHNKGAIKQYADYVAEKTKANTAKRCATRDVENKT